MRQEKHQGQILPERFCSLGFFIIYPKNRKNFLDRKNYFYYFSYKSYASDTMKDLTLTEEMLLLAVWKLGNEAYGVTIRQHVSKVTGRTYPYGTLYSALDKLARIGYLEKTTGDPTPERGGRRKYYYHLTGQGIQALKSAMQLKRLLWDRETELGIGES